MDTNNIELIKREIEFTDKKTGEIKEFNAFFLLYQGLEIPINFRDRTGQSFLEQRFFAED